MSNIKIFITIICHTPLLGCNTKNGLHSSVFVTRMLDLGGIFLLVFNEHISYNGQILYLFMSKKLYVYRRNGSVVKADKKVLVANEYQLGGVYFHCHPLRNVSINYFLSKHIK